MVNEEKIKCVIWDLDCTLWDGILLEDNQVKLKDNVKNVIKTLDARGILNTIVSRNDYNAAKTKLKKFGIWKYFIEPKIGWEDKHLYVNEIMQTLNLSENAFAFVDDQLFERENVRHHFPKIKSFDETILDSILDLESMVPIFVSEETGKRRQFYQLEEQRKVFEKSFKDDQLAFLSSLDLKCDIAKAQEEDLKRAEELTIRTHQLNSTGVTYSYDDLKGLIQSKHHELYVARLADKFGEYGTIGLILLEKQEAKLVLKLLIVSCRVISRNVGKVLLNFSVQRSKHFGVPLYADFIETDVNRKMYITYRFSGFEEESRNESFVTLAYQSNSELEVYPEYVKVCIYE